MALFSIVPKEQRTKAATLQLAHRWCSGHQNFSIGRIIILPASVHVGGTSENVHAWTVQRLLLNSAQARPRASVKEQTSVRERGTELKFVFRVHLMFGQHRAVQSRNARVRGFDPGLQLTTLGTARSHNASQVLVSVNHSR